MICGEGASYNGAGGVWYGRGTATSNEEDPACFLRDFSFGS